jgi:hypothetical protein
MNIGRHLGRLAAFALACETLALVCCQATTVVQASFNCGGGGSAGAPSTAPSVSSVTTGPSGGPFCTWVAQNGSKIECPVDIGMACQAPAGPSWCAICRCADPVTNKADCSLPPCVISCPMMISPLPSGGCLLVYGMCNDDRTYQVTCPGSGKPCQCRIHALYGKDEEGPQTNTDICSLEPDKQLEAVNAVCHWQIHVN